MIISGIIFTFLYTYNYFKTAVRQITIFDIVLSLLGQSTEREPLKLVHKIVVLTAMAVSFIMMNDILTDILSILVEKEELPFESYEDLYNSGLKIYTSANFEYF